MTRKSKRGYRSSTDNLLTEESAVESENEITLQTDNNTTIIRQGDETQVQATTPASGRSTNGMTSPNQLTTQDTVMLNQPTSQRFTGVNQQQFRRTNEPQVQTMIHGVEADEHVNGRNEENRRLMTVTEQPNNTGVTTSNMTSAEVKVLARELVNALNQNLPMTMVNRPTNEERATNEASEVNPTQTNHHHTTVLNDHHEQNNVQVTTNNNVPTHTEQARTTETQKENIDPLMNHGAQVRMEERGTMQRTMIHQPQTARMPETAIPRTPVRRQVIHQRLVAPGRFARRAEHPRTYPHQLYDDYATTASESEDYSTSQEDYETVEERFANGSDWRQWPWPKMRRAIKLNQRYGGPAPYPPPQERREPSRETENRLSRQLEQMEMKMQLQQFQVQQLQSIFLMESADPV